MLCKHCGFPGSDDDRFCTKCGRPQPVHCPACAAEVRPDAKFCSACGHALSPQVSQDTPVKPASAKPAAGERKQVTILFGDFAGYTAFSSKLDPEDVSDYMDSIWKKVDALIAAHGGSAEKHSGDGVMAVFGGRKTREEDPAEAVRAALDIQAWLKAGPKAG